MTETPATQTYVIETEYADEAPSCVDCIHGRPVGLQTSDWPRCRGVPMQLLATLDLREKKLALRGVAMVFVDSYYELDFGAPETIAFRLVDDASLEAIPVTEPPDDYVEEPFPKDQETRLVLAELEDDSEVDEEESYVGGEPLWPEEAGAPEAIPSGRFLMRLFNLLPSPMTNCVVG